MLEIAATVGKERFRHRLESVVLNIYAAGHAHAVIGSPHIGGNFCRFFRTKFVLFVSLR